MLIYLVLALFLICLFLMEGTMYFPWIVEVDKILDSIFVGIKQSAPNYARKRLSATKFLLVLMKEVFTNKEYSKR